MIVHFRFRISCVCINLGPFRTDLLILRLSRFTVQSRSLESLCTQTLVDSRLCIVTCTDCLDQKAASMAFVESRHDLFACCGELACAYTEEKVVDVYLCCLLCANGDAFRRRGKNTSLTFSEEWLTMEVPGVSFGWNRPRILTLGSAAEDPFLRLKLSDVQTLTNINNVANNYGAKAAR